MSGNSADGYFLCGEMRSFADDMKRLVNNKEMSDVRFLVGPQKKTIYAHRAILSGRCQVFRAMFSEQINKGKDADVPLVIADTSVDVFMSIIEYIYTNCITLSRSIIISILNAAIEYGLEELKKLCIKFLTDHYTPDNVCDALQAGVTYSESDLQLSSLGYIERNTAAVFHSKRFNELSEAAIIEILKSDDLRLDEADVIDVIHEWLKVQNVVSGISVQKAAKSIATYLRLPLLSPDELAALEEKNAKGRFIAADLFAFAWKCHALKKMPKDNPVCRRRTGTKKRECHSFIED